MFLHTVVVVLAQPELSTTELVALVAPTFIFLLLISITTLVALAGGRDRSRQARLILGDLLAVVIPRRRGGRR